MITDQTLRAEFAELFSYPLAPIAVPTLLASRDWRKFEQFVDYTFERAGYGVEDVAPIHDGSNIDLKVFRHKSHANPVAIVQVKLYQEDITPEKVHAFGGVTQNANGAIGYLVSASGFGQRATDQAKNYQNLRLVDGQILLRYITYIVGARLPDDPQTIISLESLFEADAIKRRSIQETVIMAIANEKGGVGKTTSTINLATWLGQQGKRVLVIDLDTQSNLTDRIPLRREPGHGAVIPTMVDYFLGKRELSHLVLPTTYRNVYSIASSYDVKLITRGVSEWTDQFLTFARNLHSPDVRPPIFEAPSFDWILLDTPTADEYRIRLALAAANVVMAPTLPSVFGFKALEALFASVRSMQGLMGSGLGKKGCFMTQCASLGVRSLQDYFALLRQVLGNWQVPLLQSTIPRLASIETAHRNRRSVFPRHGDPSAVARAYAALGEEIVEHVSQ